MTRTLAKAKYLKIIDIQSILRYIFLKEKRPNFIQLLPQPKLVTLIHFKDGSALMPDLAGPRKTSYDGFRNLRHAEQKCISNSSLIRLNITRSIRIIDKMPIGTIFHNVLNSMDVGQVDLGYITPDNLKCIEKQDVNHLFSYSTFINSNVDFNTAVFETYHKPTKETDYFVVAIDCEMVKTDWGPEVGRVSIVDHQGAVIYDKYIRPIHSIRDYLTKYSGLTLENTSAGITFEELHSDLRDIVGKSTCIVGHGLENDLESLKFHTENVIDTSYLFLNSEGYKIGLGILSKKFFNEDIQSSEHDSIADAMCCIKLLALKIMQTKYFLDGIGGTYLRDIKVSAIHDISEAKGEGLRLLETEDFDFDHHSDSRNFLIFLYSNGEDNFIAFNSRIVKS